MIIAFDDTDSLAGGCTTYALFHVLANLPDLAPRGMPRLVRLNPNVPWKTRGNGAVCVELVRPTGPHVVVGEWQGMELRAYPDGESVQADSEVLDAAWAAIQSIAETDANPAVAVFDAAPSSLHYWGAVRMLVEPGEAVAYAKATGLLNHFTADGRALIGCLAAAAWAGPASSYEFIAYRPRNLWGTPRAVNPVPLQGLDKTGITFHTEDLESAVLCCVPHTPCPVLLGLRGTDPERLLQTARSTIPLAAQEPLEGWILWSSNQASGDHVSPVESLLEAESGMTLRMPATVHSLPENLEGGHVRLSCNDLAGTPFTCMAFEPTKSFRDTIRQLLPGDKVTVTGGWKDQSIRLESIAIISCTPAKSSNPRHCDKPMKSRGAGSGYKCPVCGITAGAQAATFNDRAALIGSYEVPVMARRHLHRPLAWTQE